MQLINYGLPCNACVCVLAFMYMIMSEAYDMMLSPGQLILQTLQNIQNNLFIPIVN